MDRPVPRSQDIADEAEIRDAYQFYVGRDPSPQTVAAMLENGTTVGKLEAEIVTRSREYWTRGPVLATHRRGPWDGSILVIEAARVVFYPIAKVANTSVKDWALRLAGYDGDLPVHTLLDSGQIQMQARQHSERRFDAIMRNPDWARVAILRDPLDRLVSCYLDKFVRNRSSEGVLHHTAPVYRFVFGDDAPAREQIAEGITFRQFCHYINLSPRGAMDPHWAPQSRYLETFRWDHLFRIEQIDAFERFILDRCAPEQRHIRLGQRNAAPIHPEPSDRLLADIAPRHLSQLSSLSKANFLAPDIVDFVRDYFALDYGLLDCV